MRSLDEDDFQARLVFAEYGFAAFSAQKLENRLLLALQVANVRASEFQTLEDAREHIEKNSVISMGALIVKLRPIIGDEDLSAQLRDALVERNRFVHQFFRNHEEDELTAAGTDSMIRECRDLAELFQSTAEKVMEQIVRSLDEIGEDPDRFLPGLAERAARLRAEYPEGPEV